MKAYKRRIFAFVLAMSMIIPLLPGDFVAQFLPVANAASTYDITDDNFETRMSATDLNVKGNTFNQTENISIDLSSAAVKNWVLNANYNGNGYTITVTGEIPAERARNNEKLPITTKSTRIFYTGGVFAEVAKNAKVENLHVNLVNASSKGTTTGLTSNRYSYTDDYFGGIAGKNSGTITDCVVTGSFMITQKIEDQSFSTKDNDTGTVRYNGLSSTRSSTIVGGIAGTTVGTIQGCYSSVTLKLGTNDKDTFYCKWDRNNAGDYEKNRNSLYTLYAGGIAGTVTGGKVENNLAEGVTIYAGNTSRESELKSNQYTGSDVGGLIGRTIGNSTLSGNVVRNSNMYAPNDRNTYTCFGVGFVDSFSMAMSGNYYSGIVTEGKYSGYPAYGYLNTTLQVGAFTNGFTSSTSVPSNSTWVSSGLMNGQSNTSPSSISTGTLKIRQIDAPTVDVTNAIGTGNNSITVTITPPSAKPISGADWSDADWANAAGRIRYQLKVSTQLAAPTVTKLTDDNNKSITITNTDKKNGAAIGTAYWGETTSTINQTGPIPAPIDSATSKTYYIQTKNSGDAAIADSQIYKITVSKTTGTKGKPASPTGERASLGYSAFALTYTDPAADPEIPGKVQWSTNNTTFRDYDSDNAINLETLSYTNNTATIYAKTVPIDMADYEDSSTVSYRITRAGTEGSYTYTVGEGTGGNTESEPVAAKFSNLRTSSYTSAAYTTFSYNDITPIHSLTTVTDSSGKPVNVMKLNKTDIHITPGSSVSLKTWMYAPRVVVGNKSISVGDFTAMPTISPDLSGNLRDGLTITAQPGDTIYYTLDGTDPTTATTTQGTNGKVELSWSQLASTFTGNALTVKAIAKNAVDEPSAVAQIIYGVDNKPGGDPPYLTIAGAPFSSTTYYTPGAEVHFGHAGFPGNEEDEAEIWYTMDGTTPNRAAAMRNGQAYDPLKPVKLPDDGKSSVLIQAILYRNNYPASELLSETVTMKSKHGSPVFSIANNAKIAIGQTLAFLPNPEDFPPEIRPTYYMKEGDTNTYTLEDVRNNPGEYYGVLEVEVKREAGSIVNTFNYSDYTMNIPILSYTIDGNTRDYNFGTPEIRYFEYVTKTEVTAEGTITYQEKAYIKEEELPKREHVAATRIELNGEAGKQITVEAQLKSSNLDRYTDGAKVTQAFTFQVAVATPKASPGTADDNLTTMSLGQTLSLSSMTSGAQIFYSLTGMPLIMWDGSQYVPARYDPTRLDENNGYIVDDGSGGVDQTTFAYDSVNGIPVQGTPGSYFVVYAGAVKTDMSPSEIGTFTYRIADLNSVAAPTATPNTSAGSVATIDKESKVIMVSATTGAKIFYSFTGEPVVSLGSSGSYIKGEGTFDYDDVRATGIPVSGNPGNIYNIYTIAMKENMADSEVVTLTYKIAELPLVASPMVTPQTSENNVTTLEGGTKISLVCATTGADIYYSTTGLPSFTGDVPDAGTLRYNPSEGITVTGSPNGFYWVSAIAKKDGMTPSNLVTFTFKIAALPLVEAPVASPLTSDNNVTTLTGGAKISLTCATTGAKIYYSTSGLPSLTNGVPDAGTKEYSITEGIPVEGNPGDFFWLSAIAVKAGMTDSNLVTFTYKIAELPLVATPAAAPQTSENSVTTLVGGTKISLACATTGAKIYYSTTGMPAVVNGVPAEGTKEYSITDGIPVEGNPGSFYWVSAIAVKAGMTDSNLVTFTYKIAELPIAAAPTATPKTEDGSPVTLQSGSVVTLQTETSGAFIYYSLTGTPTVTRNGAAYTPGAGTFLFDKSITVSGNAGEFFIIRALTVKDGYQESEIATFNYQLPAPVQAVYATPGEGSVVKGTEVTLATTTAGAAIYYETAAKETDLIDPVPGESPVYEKPLKIEAKTFISALAVKDGVESILTEYEFTVASQVTAPSPSIPSGSVVAKGTKVSFTTSSGASITYTKDGSDPTDEKNTKRMHGADIAIDAEEGKSVSISVYAHRTGMTPSEVVSVSYTVSKSDEVMSANPPGGSIVKPGDRITLSTSVTGSEIYYTTDGSEPTRDSRKGSTVLVDGAYGEAFILRAIAATDSTVSTPFVFNYSIIASTSAPSASIPSGAIILEGAQVTLTAPEGNIYYTTDGSDPTPNSQMYTAPFMLTGSTVLKAIALADGKAESEIAEYVYTMAGQVAAPTASMPSGTIAVGSEIRLSTTTAGAIIYYTTNGAAPTMNTLRDCFTYESPITISRPVSIRMFAVMQGMNPSVVNTVTYTVAYPEPEEEAEEEEAVVIHDTDRLFLFDQFVDSGEGPLFEDIVLRDSPTLAVISASENALPAGTQLMVERERTFSAEDADAVMKSLEMEICALYDINLVDATGAAVQPLAGDSVEIGVPIPEGYEDTIVLICRINDNGTVTSFPTRRSAGMLYAVVDHFSKYAVAVPPAPETEQPLFQTWHLWLLAAVAAMAGIVILIVVTTKKRKAN